MKITAFTSCVGEQYANYLKKSLPIWGKNCDLLVIVTDRQTAPFLETVDAPTASFIVSDIFTAHGASFNKGAALSSAFGYFKPKEWVLNFDADILPPADWRRMVEPRLQPGKLFGCSHRYREDGTKIPDANFPNIWGFFHLWNVGDPHSWRRPVFDSTCGHAGNYDHTFMMQWPEKCRVDLWPELKLVHQGDPRQRWFGNDPKNDKKMFNLFTLGLYDAWMTRAGHIVTPKPNEVVISAKHNDEEAILWALDKYTDPDPWKYRVTMDWGVNAP